jgi:hypothetical protein
MMDAARLKRARWRLRAYFFGSGILMAAIYLCLAATIMAMFGLQATSYAVTLVLAAAALAGGTFAIIYFAGAIVNVARRLWYRQPIMEGED